MENVLKGRRAPAAPSGERFLRYCVFAPSALVEGPVAFCGVEVPGVDAPPDMPALLCGAPDTVPVPVPGVEPLLARSLEPDVPVDVVSAPAGAGAVFAELEVDGIELLDELALPLPARTEFPVPEVSEEAFGAALDGPVAEPPAGEPDIVAVGDWPDEDVVPEEVDVPVDDDVPDDDDLLLPEDEPLSPQAPSARRPMIAVAARRRLPISLLPSCNLVDHTAKRAVPVRALKGTGANINSFRASAKVWLNPVDWWVLRIPC